MFYIGACPRIKSTERKIFFHRHEWKYLAAFRNMTHAKRNHFMRRDTRDILASKTQRAAARRLHAGDNAEQRSLPCSVGADKGNDFTGIYTTSDGVPSAIFAP